MVGVMGADNNCITSVLFLRNLTEVTGIFS